MIFSGSRIKKLMRVNHVTIAALAASMGVTQTRVRQVRAAESRLARSGSGRRGSTMTAWVIRASRMMGAKSRTGS